MSNEAKIAEGLTELSQHLEFLYARLNSNQREMAIVQERYDDDLLVVDEKVRQYRDSLLQQAKRERDDAILPITVSNTKIAEDIKNVQSVIKLLMSDLKA